MKLTRHNGRTGKHGTYNPRHNDRRFDVDNSDHIDAERAKRNIYWDCYRGFTTAGSREDTEHQDFTFEEIERIYYTEHYADHVDAQNARNEKTRHTERNRTVEDLLKNNKTCPEESIYQIGTVEESVPPDVLFQIVNEFYEEFERRFGSRVHILDWALHLDEGTPHIHERHVFDCENRYGEVCPQQEKALEELGVPLPNPDKPKGRNNNRKQTFDAVCRTLLFDITHRHGLHLEQEPSYGGREYLEKQDYILMKQKEQIERQTETISRQTETLDTQAAAIEQGQRRIDSQDKTIQSQQEMIAGQTDTIERQDETIQEQTGAIAAQEEKLDELILRIGDVETLLDEMADAAYDKAVEIVTDTVRAETQKADLKIVADYEKWLTAPERKSTEQAKSIMKKCLDVVQDKIRKAAGLVLTKVMETMKKPEVKKAGKEQIKKQVRPSIKAQLEKGRIEMGRREQERKQQQAGRPKTRKQDMEL